MFINPNLDFRAIREARAMDFDEALADLYDNPREIVAYMGNDIWALDVELSD